MPDNIVSSRLISANHTSSVWATITTVPKLGEICLETDTKKIKVGNGTDIYADLPYFNEGFNTITDGTDSVVITGGELTLTASGGATLTYDNTNKSIDISTSAGSETAVESGNSTGGLGSLKVTKDGNVTYPVAYGLGTMAGEAKTDYLALSGGTMTGALSLSGAPSSNLHAATKKYVDDAISGLPTPMQFKGTVGTSGTVEWSALPSASSSNEGFTYKVITDHATAPVCKTGDTIVSNGSAWVVIPSGDEPSGTVTNVATGNGLTGGPITSTGTISHADTSSQASITATTLKYVDALTLDDFGHVTAATVSSVPTLSGSADGIVAHYTGSGTKTDYYLRADGTWGTIPSGANTYHKSGSWNGTTYTATLVGGTAGTDDLAFTLPDMTSSAKGVSRIANTTASGGISASISNGVVTLSHSNTITAVTTEKFATLKYDANGHITGATAITIIDGNFT